MAMNQAEFDHLKLTAAAHQWGVAAAEAAKHDHERISADTLDHWLDTTETPDLRSVGDRDPDLADDLRATAAEAAEKHARLMQVWSD